ncbi:MAG: DUF4105 domain-containing protein [Treponematales bacterium]
MRNLAAALALLLVFLPGLPCQSPSQAAGGGERLAVKLAVIGPGDELYFWWGHIGLVIEDRVTGQNRLFDWGVFSFENEHFFRNFAFGRLLYSCAASPASRNFRNYRAMNRDITLYTLDLPPETKEAVRRFAEWNIQPENRDYYYHHFKDNCATRVRDILDTATGGAFRTRYGEAPGRFTLRQHVRRHTWAHPFADWGLNFLMGQDIDTPLRVWDEMFLPSEIGLRAREFTWTDAAGAERRLVSAVETVNAAEGRPPVLAAPRTQWPRELAAGAALAAALAGFRALARRKRTERAGNRLLGLSQALLGLFFGVAGSLLLFMMTLTNHDYTYHNSNILFVNPLLLAAVPLGLVFAFTKSAARRGKAALALKALWTYASAACVLTIALRLLPGFWQQNQVTEALVLPFSLVLGFLPRRRGAEA